jgi:hypothetical protein
MRTDKAQKKTPTGGANHPAGCTDREIVSAERGIDNKQFATLQAAFALRGYTLQRKRVENGVERFQVGGYGAMRELTALDDVRGLLAQFGGAI